MPYPGPQLPSSSKWGQQSPNTINQTQNALSLAEIQKLEEERERQTREEVRRVDQFNFQLLLFKSVTSLYTLY